MPKKLPIGISSLSKMIQGGYVYVDKTRYVYELVNTGEYYFLSRPRSFGKTLFVDTLKEAFEGNKDLFNLKYEGFLKMSLKGAKQRSNLIT